MYIIIRRAKLLLGQDRTGQDRTGPSVCDSKATENWNFRIGTNFLATIRDSTVLNRSGWEVWRDLHSKYGLTCLSG